MTFKDYYRILGVSDIATQQEIKAAYKKLSKKFHPDLNEGDKFFEEKFKEIQEAYEILSNGATRKQYDFNRSQTFDQKYWFYGETLRQQEEELKRKQEEFKQREEDFRKSQFDLKSKKEKRTLFFELRRKIGSIKKAHLKRVILLAVVIASLAAIRFVNEKIERNAVEKKERIKAFTQKAISVIKGSWTERDDRIFSFFELDFENKKFEVPFDLDILHSSSCVGNKLELDDITESSLILKIYCLGGKYSYAEIKIKPDNKLELSIYGSTYILSKTNSESF